MTLIRKPVPVTALATTSQPDDQDTDRPNIASVCSDFNQYQEKETEFKTTRAYNGDVQKSEMNVSAPEPTTGLATRSGPTPARIDTERHNMSMAGGGQPVKPTGSAEVTPRSSWESLSNDLPSGAPQASYQSLTPSPPLKSNNPFRQNSPTSLIPPPLSINKEESKANPWDMSSDQTLSSMSSAQKSTPPEAYRPKAPSLDQQAAYQSTGPTPATNYQNGLDELLSATHTQQSQSNSHTRSAPVDTLTGPLDSCGPSTTSKIASTHGSHPVQSPASGVLGDQNDNMMPGSVYREVPPPVPEKNILPGPVAPVTPEVRQSQPPNNKKARTTSETYQIRHVTWADTVPTTQPRRVPIMVQNANGPCPLLALVNALVLTSPPMVKTALVETLRVREQVSLGLLLDAVIDELMSGRRGDAAQNLPDVTDLYSFLVALHTGMNVNPCFVQQSEPVNLMDAPIDTPSTAHDHRMPGGFEETREMRLYSTFAVPLIHGWIPPRTHPALSALQRRARTYEDAQNLMFREEELEEKLKTSGLNEEEQVMLEDIASVKYFLSSTATQLTGYGLDTVTESLAPGSVAIFFRNDHFNTLYRHPRSGQLLTLVTDMGFAGHDEVVWESLVDVRGEGSEFYSGVFGPVGNSANEPRRTSDSNKTGQDEGWTTIQSRARKGRAQEPSAASAESESMPDMENLHIGGGSRTEQEDHDLALAMQLQEEEEDRQRRDAAARRRREDELSQDYLSSSNGQHRQTSTGSATRRGAPVVPRRGGSNAASAAPTRPAVTRRQDSTDDVPPPSYEQAAKRPAYRPAADDPYATPGLRDRSHRPHFSQPQRPRGSSAYGEQAGSYGTPSPNQNPPRAAPPSRLRGASMEGIAPGARRKNGGPVSAGLEEERREKDCIIM